MATVHRAYSTREWEEGKKWPQYIGPTLQESGGRGKNGHSTSGLLYLHVQHTKAMAT